MPREGLIYSVILTLFTLRTCKVAYFIYLQLLLNIVRLINVLLVWIVFSNIYEGWINRVKWE